MLTWRRSDGWPQQAARWTLLTGLLGLLGALAAQAPSGIMAACGLTVSLGMLLALWRRGVTLDREDSTLTRWYGLGSLALRKLDSHSLAGFAEVGVERVHHHFKRWPEMYRVVLRRPGALERLVVDDEYARIGPAQARALEVAAFLGLAGSVDPS